MGTNNKQNICIIPGVFDPVTNGHFDVVQRASKLFGKIYVVSFVNSAKKTMFNPEERVEMLKLACDGIENIEVDVTDKMLSEYAKSKDADFIAKGVRNIIDFEYESDMFRINREIGGIDTIFFPAKPEQLYISSTFVREMIIYKRDISDYVPEKVGFYINGLFKS